MIWSKVATFAPHQIRPFEDECLENTLIR